MHAHIAKYPNAQLGRVIVNITSLKSRESIAGCVSQILLITNSKQHRDMLVLGWETTREHIFDFQGAAS